MSLNLAILFENEHLIVVDKPSGWLSVPSRLGKSDPRPVVGIQLQEYVGRTIFPVHRLDEETSGLLIFAKTPKAQSLLSRSFEQHTVQKTYEAITEKQGNPLEWQNKNLLNLLVRGKKRSFEAEYGQKAETWVEAVLVLEDQPLVLWLLKPKTGRSHQLRVQLALRLFPIVGDQLYGSKVVLPSCFFLPQESLREKSIGLRAVRLEFQNTADLAAISCPQTFEALSWKTTPFSRESF